MKLLAAWAPYLITAVLCFVITTVRGPAAKNPPLRSQRLAWAATCLAILLLGALRPYEVHSGLTQILRSSAMTSGWYPQRADQQLDLIYVAGFVMAVLALFLLIETRRWHIGTRAGILMLFYLAGLFVMNILSLHAVDRALGRELAGVPLRWLLDFVGLGAMIVAALWYRRALRSDVAGERL